jgi:hypothetical protein
MSISTVAIGLVLLLQQVYAPADFTQVQGTSLKARYDAAVSQGSRGSDDSYWVAYRFPVRPGVRITTWENNISISYNRSTDGIEWLPDPADIQRIAIFALIGKDDGVIQKTRLINLAQNFRVHDRKVYWLGEPNAEESLAVLGTLALGSPQKFSSSLFHYMSLHDSPNVASRLLAVARDASQTMEIRTNALTYLGREIATPGATQELEKLASDPNTQIQKQAVTVIARRPDDESVPSLIRIAKEHPNQAVRQQAIRSLGQKKDQRVIDFFEQLLKKK